MIDTSPLIICKIFQKEAVIAFHNCYTFHYSTRRIDDPPPQFETLFPLIQHLSIDYTRKYPRSGNPKGADAHIAKHLQIVRERSSRLRTLSLHILANEDTNQEYQSVLGKSATAVILRSMQPKLGRLGILTFG